MRVPYDCCPLCEATGAAEVLVADCTGHELYKKPLPPTLRWLQCAKCAHIFVDGYFTPQALKILFAATPTNQLPGQDIEGQRFAWASVLHSVGTLRPPRGRWLDVGFGSGALLATAAEFGYEVAGIDLREENVRLMREAGFDVTVAELEDYRAAPFDVLSLADVLEHVPFPKRTLRRARELLDPGGLLFLSMPNADAFVWQATTRNRSNPYWGEIEHYHNFGRRRLSALLEECGFEVARYGVSFRYRMCMELIARKRPA